MTLPQGTRVIISIDEETPPDHGVVCGVHMTDDALEWYYICRIDGWPNDTHKYSCRTARWDRVSTE
jgi:hypothetical protein